MSDHEHDALINEIASELKRPVRFSGDFDARVMSAIRTSHLSVVRGGRTEVVARRRRMLFPAVGTLAAAAALTFVVMRSGGEPNEQQLVNNSTPLVQVADNGDERAVLQDRVVSIFLPGAKSVGVMGAFNDWDAARNPMKRDANGTWTITLRLLPGSYEYQFLVDGGTRMTDPTAPATDSEFGEANSVLTVTPRVGPQ
ncbi:MAG: isoamylase early set domain-containing protein [Gemmatimonadota bacterium]